MVESTQHRHSGAHPGTAPVSLLRLSVAGRLAIVAVLAALLWGATFWVMQ